MKKYLLLVLLISTTSFVSASTSSSKLLGVNSVNSQPVIYVANDWGPEGAVAKVGNGSFAGFCLHDGDRYAVIRGSAICPSYFEVFPKIEIKNVTYVLGFGARDTINPAGFYLKHINGSPACDETEDLHDGFN
jgi:hypothetical protein